MKYNWHKTTFTATIKRIGRHCDQYINEGLKLDGSYEWFQETHPKVFKKYVALREKKQAMWNKSGEKSMSEFKKLCKDYEDTWKWAVDQYVAHLKEKAA